MSIRDKIKAADDRVTAQVDVPEWGVTVTIRELSGRDRDDIALLFIAAQQPDPANPGGKRPGIPEYHREQYIIRSVIDDATGELMFTADDLPWLAEKSQRALERLVDAIQELSAMDEGAIDDAVEKSQPGPKLATGTG